jgi:hypothetical protein
VNHPRTRLAALGAAALLGALALTGCGIRTTAVPVDAGEPASRTACPPSGSAAAGVLQPPDRLASAAATPVPAPEGDATPWAQLSPAAPATPSPAAPTASDGTLSCLHSTSPEP